MAITALHLNGVMGIPWSFSAKDAVIAVTLERKQTVSISGVQVVGSTPVTLDAYMTRDEGTAVYYVPGGSGVTIVGPF